MRAWIADDVDPAAAAELQALLDAGDETELADRFAGPLTFGTAGLRGPLRAGPNGMNRTVVRRAAAGPRRLVAGAGAPGEPVVVGYDARHGSADFARDSAAIFAAAGFDARLLPGQLPTPVLAFAVQHLQRRGRGDGDGVAQPAAGQRLQGLCRPTARRSSRRPTPRSRRPIAAVGASRAIPLDEPGSPQLGDELVDAYVDAVARLIAPGPRDLRIVHTAMHGVGADTLRRVLSRRPASPTSLPVSAAGATRPRLPDRRVPEPRGARRDRPRRSRWPAGSTPTS